MVVFNAAFVVVMIYSAFYLLLDVLAGLTWASLVGVPLWLAATAFQQSVSGCCCGAWSEGLARRSWRRGAAREEAGPGMHAVPCVSGGWGLQSGLGAGKDGRLFGLERAAGVGGRVGVPCALAWCGTVFGAVRFQYSHHVVALSAEAGAPKLYLRRSSGPKPAGGPPCAQVPAAWQWALGVHVFSWYMQIHPGHALLEGRKPALLDSLVQQVQRLRDQAPVGQVNGALPLEEQWTPTLLLLLLSQGPLQLQC